MFIQYGAEINSCNQSFSQAEHAENCHGKCERVMLTDTQVDLHNEMEHWKKAGMAFQGVPQTEPHFPINGIGINLLQLDTMVKALVVVLDVDEKELNAKIEELMLHRLRGMRTIVESEKLIEGVLVPKPTIFLPGNGKEDAP